MSTTEQGKSTSKSKTKQRQQRSKSPAPDTPSSPSSSSKQGVKVSPKSGTSFPGYNFHPVLRIYSNAPVASASTSPATATGNTFDPAQQFPHARGSPKARRHSNIDERTRKTSTESLRRHIASQNSPTTSDGSRTTARSLSSPRQLMRSSSSSSSSSISSIAGTDPPGYTQGLGLNLKPAVPLPPTVDNGVAFPSMEKSTPSIPIDLSPAHSSESLKSCIKEAPKQTNSNGNGVPEHQSPTVDDSPTTRKRRSVSFAVEDPVVHHLLTSSRPADSGTEAGISLSDYVEAANETRQEENSLIPFPTFDSPSPRTRRLSGIFPDRFIGMDAAGSLYTYIRSNTLSTFSSHTSLSSDSWPDDQSVRYDNVSFLRKLVETALGLSLAVGWLAVGRVVGSSTPQASTRLRIHDEHPHESEDTSRNHKQIENS